MKKLPLLWLVCLLLFACGSPTELASNPDASESSVSAPVVADEETTSEESQEETTSDEPQVESAENYPVATSFAEANVLRASDNAKGGDDYAVLIVEYGDFQCPACAQLAPLISQIAQENSEDAKVVFRHLPLREIHPNAQKAAEASEAAAAQDAFWAYHDALYERQQEWARLDADGARDFFITLAEELNLDTERFASELDSDFHAPKVNANHDEALALSLPGTPSILLDGQVFTGQTIPLAVEPWNDYISNQAKIVEMLEMQYDAAPEMTIDEDKQYFATVALANGDEFTIELYPKSAPQTVNSFIFLAREGFFDGVTFHRVLPGFVAQTGDPSGTGQGGPGYALPNEIDSELSHAQPGMVAMANGGPDTNGSQWYITLANASELDGGYTIFGMVTEGMEVVQEITPRDPRTNPNAPAGDEIVSIEISEQ